MIRNDFTVIIPSHRPQLAMQARESLDGVDARILKNKSIDEPGPIYPSFSQMINHCIMYCPTEIAIICNDKARATDDDCVELCGLLDKNYGFVSFYGFRFFGFYKELIRKIGWFDERYLGGEYEDFDFLRRIQEADIAVYFEKKVKCVELPPSWDNRIAKEWNFKKWQEHITHTVRLLPDEKYPYDIGGLRGRTFLPYSKSVYLDPGVALEFTHCLNMEKTK